MPEPHAPLTAELVEPLLRGRFGRPYRWTAECASTQEALRGGELPEGAVAVTDHQTAGRGREGRTWADLPGRSLLLSLLLRPPPALATEQLSLVAALAVADTVEAASSSITTLKWPNDVLLDGHKVSGILLEASAGAVVCGIGVNVNQTAPELPTGTPTPAGSLRTATGREHDRAMLLADLLVRLQRRYDEWLDLGLALSVPELERRDALRGRHVRIGAVAGTAAGIAPDGRLRVVGADGTEALVVSGEVELQGRA